MADDYRILHRGGTIQLASLVGVVSYELRYHRFEDVTLTGPGVVVPHETLFKNCDWGGSLREVWMEAPEGTMLKGVITVRNCEFVECRFIGLGFVGTPDELARAGEHITD